MKVVVHTFNQIGIGISWGNAVIPNRAYFCIDLPFLTIQFFLWKPKNKI